MEKHVNDTQDILEKVIWRFLETNKELELRRITGADGLYLTAGLDKNIFIDPVGAGKAYYNGVEIGTGGGGGITGSGTINYIPRFTGASAIGNSHLIDDGTKISSTEDIQMLASTKTEYFADIKTGAITSKKVAVETIDFYGVQITPYNTHETFPGNFYIGDTYAAPSGAGIRITDTGIYLVPVGAYDVKIYNSIMFQNTGGGELGRSRLQNVSSPPSIDKGGIYYDTDDNNPYVNKGTYASPNWQPLGGFTNPLLEDLTIKEASPMLYFQNASGNPLGSIGSLGGGFYIGNDVDAGSIYIRTGVSPVTRMQIYDTGVALGVPIAMNSQKITGLAAASANGDALRYEQLIGQYLPLTGGTLTGDLWLSEATPRLVFDVSGVVADLRLVGNDLKFYDPNNPTGKTLTELAAGGAVTSVFGRTGAVVAATNDYTWAQINKTTSSVGDVTTRDHHLLAGLSDDDHTQYLLINGARAMTGDLTIKEASPMLYFQNASGNPLGSIGSLGGGFYIGNDVDAGSIYIRTGVSPVTRMQIYDTGVALGVPIAMNSQKITGLAAASANGDALRYEQLISQYLPLTGGTLTGDLTIKEASPMLYFQNASGNPFGSIGSLGYGFYIGNDVDSGVIDIRTGATPVTRVQIYDTSVVLGVPLSMNSGTIQSLSYLRTPDDLALLMQYGTTAPASKLMIGSGITAYTSIAMSSNKITGLAAGTVAGDAIRFEQLITDHGALTGLGDDDHTQYLLADGTRTLTTLRLGGGLSVKHFATAYGYNYIESTNIVKIGQVTLTGNNQNIIISGEIRGQAGYSFGTTRFVLAIRSNTLPDMAFSFVQNHLGLARVITVKPYYNGGNVVLTFTTNAQLHNVGWDIAVDERSSYNYFQNEVGFVTFDPTGFTLIDETVSAIQSFHEILDMNSGIIQSLSYLRTPDGLALLMQYGTTAPASKLMIGSGITAYTDIAMSSQKITGLAAGTVAGDALRYEQVIGLYALLASDNIFTGDHQTIRGAGGSEANFPMILLRNTTFSATDFSALALEDSGYVRVGIDSLSIKLVGGVNSIGNIRPNATNTYTLGTSSYYWNYGYLKNIFMNDGVLDFRTDNVHKIGYISGTNSLDIQSYQTINFKTTLDSGTPLSAAQDGVRLGEALFLRKNHADDLTYIVDDANGVMEFHVGTGDKFKFVIG